MKTIKVKIEGASPLLINRFKENDEITQAVKKSTKKDYGTPREQAEATAYRDDKTGLIWIPTTWITGAIKTVSSDYKLPGTRKSIKSVIGGVVIPVAEKAYFDGKLKLADIEVDSRPVVIQRARIMRHRARLENWSVEFEIEIDETIVPVKNIHELLTDAGKRAGLGDFRPQRGGPFGRFLVTSWKIVK